MTISDEWWTSPAEAENGNLIMVTGRDRIDNVIESGKYTSRIDVCWRYDALPDGMPTPEAARVMEQVDEALKAAFHKNKVAVITGIYTGDGRRDWVLYTYNLKVFSNVFNRALQDLPLLPLEITGEEDPDWEEYRHMREETYIPPED